MLRSAEKGDGNAEAKRWVEALVQAGARHHRLEATESDFPPSLTGPVQTAGAGASVPNLPEDPDEKQSRCKSVTKWCKSLAAKVCARLRTWQLCGCCSGATAAPANDGSRRRGEMPLL